MGNEPASVIVGYAQGRPTRATEVLDAGGILNINGRLAFSCVSDPPRYSTSSGISSATPLIDRICTVSGAGNRPGLYLKLTVDVGHNHLNERKFNVFQTWFRAFDALTIAGAPVF
jgi:hypothetical protein